MNKQVEERADLTYRLAGLRRGQATRPPFVRVRPRQTETIVKRLNARYKAGLRPAVAVGVQRFHVDLDYGFAARCEAGLRPAVAVGVQRFHGTLITASPPDVRRGSAPP